MSILKQTEKSTNLLRILKFPESKKSQTITFEKNECVVDIVLCNYGDDYDGDDKSNRYQVHVFGFKKKEGIFIKIIKRLRMKRLLITICLVALVVGCVENKPTKINRNSKEYQDIIIMLRAKTLHPEWTIKELRAEVEFWRYLYEEEKMLNLRSKGL